MKKLFAIVAMVAACSFASTSSVMAQEEAAPAEAAVVDSAAVDSVAEEAEAVEAAPVEDVTPVEEEENLHPLHSTTRDFEGKLNRKRIGGD